jgi:hypothetical protein
MTSTENGGSSVNYEPNSLDNNIVEDKDIKDVPMKVNK